MTEAKLIINDANLSPDLRLEVLARLVKKLPKRNSVKQSNNHIHTCYSFSPYTPSAAALNAWEAGLDVAGSVDHDSIAAAKEMREAAKLLNMFSVTGCELRVSFNDEFLNKVKINNPDSLGIAYMTIQAVPERNEDKLDIFLRPIRAARKLRISFMTQKLNDILQSINLPSIDFENDIVKNSKFDEGGTITERHMLYALAKHIVKFSECSLIDFFEKKLNVSLSKKNKDTLQNPNAEHILYDMLGILKSAFLDRIFIQPEYPEIVSAETAVEMALSISAIPAYAYLGDVHESPTGDKKSEQFEDSYLEALFDILKKYNYKAVTYMPPRNTLQQLQRVSALCNKHGFIEISGVDINSPRQNFHCNELQLPEFSHLDDTTFAMAAHEILANASNNFSIFSEYNPLATLPLLERIRLYASIAHDFERY